MTKNDPFVSGVVVPVPHTQCACIGTMLVKPSNFNHLVIARVFIEKFAHLAEINDKNMHHHDVLCDHDRSYVKTIHMDG